MFCGNSILSSYLASIVSFDGRISFGNNTKTVPLLTVQTVDTVMNTNIPSPAIFVRGYSEENGTSIILFSTRFGLYNTANCLSAINLNCCNFHRCLTLCCVASGHYHTYTDVDSGVTRCYALTSFTAELLSLLSSHWSVGTRGRVQAK